MQRQVIVTLRVEGIHHWPLCPIEEVSFLREKHRHIFHIKAKKTVTHNDRDIEIIVLKRDIEHHFQSLGTDFGSMSCEDIAENLVKKFSLNYCEVLEDGENGAEVFI